MEISLFHIQQTLQDLFRKQVPPLQIRKDNEKVFEVAGTKEAMQGKQKVDGYYFGSVVPKPNDIRLYYFPIYTHPDQFSLSPELRKCLKGKSCFHLKKLTPELELEIAAMIRKGIKVYLEAALI